MKGIEQGCYKGGSRQEPKVVFLGLLTVSPLVLANIPWHMTRTKQCILLDVSSEVEGK